MILELVAAAQFAAVCAPDVAFETLASVMRTESGFDTLAINVNGESSVRRRPATREAAVELVSALISEGRSVDLGLMQVNSRNLRVLGLSVADAFDPCTNLRAGAHLLREGYVAAARAEPDPQQALRVALSRYNSGSSTRGFFNGYVARVQAAAEVIVPAIRMRGEPTGPVSATDVRRPPPAVAAPISAPAPVTPSAPSAQHAWDVWALPAPEPALSAPPSAEVEAERPRVIVELQKGD